MSEKHARPYRFPTLHKPAAGPDVSNVIAPAAFFDPAAIEEKVEARVREALEGVRAQAFLKGHAAGLAEGQAAAEKSQRQRETEVMAQLAGGFGHAEGILRESIVDMERRMLSAMRTLVRRLAPRLLEAGFGTRLEDMMKDAFKRIGAGAALELRLNPADAALVGERMSMLAEQHGHSLEVIGIARIPQGSSDLRWGDGGVRFDARDLFEALSVVLDQNENFQAKEKGQ